MDDHRAWLLHETFLDRLGYSWHFLVSVQFHVNSESLQFNWKLVLVNPLVISNVLGFRSFEIVHGSLGIPFWCCAIEKASWRRLFLQDKGWREGPWSPGGSDNGVLLSLLRFLGFRGRLGFLVGQCVCVELHNR